MAKQKDMARDDVNQGDVRASVADDPNPRPSNPQTYDGGDPLPGGGGIDHNSTVDNAAKAEAKGTATVKADQTVPRILKNAKIRLKAQSYIGDVLYDEGAVIESYSGPDAPHFEKL